MYLIDPREAPKVPFSNDILNEETFAEFGEFESKKLYSIAIGYSRHFDHRKKFRDNYNKDEYLKKIVDSLKLAGAKKLKEKGESNNCYFQQNDQ